MMKRLFFTLLVALATLMAMAQTYTVNISGFVLDIDSGDPIPGQMVTLMTDSIPGNFIYFNTVYTNEAGFFQDNFQVPMGVEGGLFVMTTGCEGSTLIETVSFSEDDADFEFTFLSCSDPGGGEGCNALFFYYPDEADPNTIYFTDVSEGFPDTWYWEFGDGASSGDQNPVHTYAEEGEYWVNLTISSDSLNCTSTVALPIYVGDSTWFPDSCLAMFYAYPDQEDFLTMNFVDLSIGNGNTPPDNWFWSFGDGASSDEQNPVHTYAGEGTYEVCLTISTDDSSCFNTLCEYVVVSNWDTGCQAQFIYYPVYDSVPSGNYGIQFLDYSLGNPSSWDWDFGDGGTSTLQSPVHLYADTGYYEVCLTIANEEDSCESTICQGVYVYQDSVIDCYAWFDYTINEGLEVDFSGWSTSNTQGQYDWDFGDGTSGNGQHVTHTYAAEGIYTVVMTYTDSLSGCFSTYTEAIWLGGELTFDIYGNVYLEDSLWADLANVYLMTFDTLSGELVSTAETETGDNGYYSFSEVAQQNCIYFVQAELHEASSYYGDYLPTYHYDAMTWQDAWPVLPYPSGMSYDIMMIPADGPDAGNGTISGTVSNEIRDIMAHVEIVLMDEAGTALAYERTDEAGYFEFEALAYGTYLVHAEMPGILGEPFVVVLHEETPSASMNIIIRNGEALLNIREPVSLRRVSEAYPNPARSSASIRIELGEASELTLVLRNSMGQELSRNTAYFQSGSHNVRMDLAGMPEGLYLVEINLGEGDIVIKKLVKLE